MAAQDLAIQELEDDTFGTASKEGEPCHHVNALHVSQAQFG
jgi:hypothetical protein